MTLHEAEIALNVALLAFVKTAATWGIEAYAVWFFGRRLWRRLDLPPFTRAAVVKAFTEVRAVVMSRPAASPEPAPPVRTDTTAVQPPADTTLADVLRLAASLKKADGAWYWSANELAAWSKASRNETLAVVREVRGEQAVAVTQAHRPEREYAGSAGHRYEAPPV